MKTSRMNLMLSASALALALALAGCGGGGGGGGINPPINTGGDMPMTDQEKLAAAYMELVEAREAVAALEPGEDRTEALVRRDEAEMAYAAAWALDGNAEDRRSAKLRADAIGPGGILLTDTERTRDAFTVSGGTLTEVSPPAGKFGVSTNFPNARDLGDRFSGGHVMVREFGEYGEDGYNGQWVIPHTDKEADKDARFSEYYGTSGEQAGPVTGDAGFKWKAWAPGVLSDGRDITIDSGATPDTFKLFDFDFTMDENEAADAYTFTGAFHGIPGKLTCATSCTAPTFDANGMVTSIADTWTFTPTATGAARDDFMVADVKEDAEYLDFGVWGTFAEVDQEGESREYGVFYQVSKEGNSLRTLEGKAEYRGMASGTYAKKTENPDGMLEPTSHGGFTATAVLTAKFAGGDIPANDHNTISGTISDFRDGGYPIDETWTVTLERADIADDGVIGDTTAGTTKAAGSMTEGKWTGAFLGGDGSDGDLQNHVMPSAVTGTFGAHFTNGHVVGAFGAHHQQSAE